VVKNLVQVVVLIELMKLIANLDWNKIKGLLVRVMMVPTQTFKNKRKMSRTQVVRDFLTYLKTHKMIMKVVKEMEIHQKRINLIRKKKGVERRKRRLKPRQQLRLKLH
jgi:hypothetical protein